MRKLFTSESVTEGHPDKICDIISDAVLDECLRQDPLSRVAVECLVKNNTLIVAGELTTKANLLINSIVNRLGYSFKILDLLDKQSPDIAMGVDTGGAGDQGLMFGYATNETASYMPAPIHYAHKLAQQLDAIRKAKKDVLLPDGKTQVTFEYDERGRPARIDTIVVSAQHFDNISQGELRHFIMDNVICQIIPSQLIDHQTKFHINPTGRFVIGGPEGDCGLTGRKIIVDTYGGMGRHGGGAFSGKDPSKVDRSGCYYARYIAKNLVASGKATKCEVQIAYAIGVAEPVSVNVNTFGTGDNDLGEFVMNNFDMRPQSIIKELDLLKPIYQKTATYGHFGRESFPWERVRVK